MAKLIGSAPNQISTNGDLGSMAFEDKKNYATTSSPIYQPYRNIIINGDMSIAQRNTSVTGITTTSYYTVDRWRTINTTMGTWTQSQSTDVPSGQGFANSLKMDCTTADASPGAADVIVIQQLIEGQNLQYLKKGTSNAESITVSFWVKSNKTGTYICELRDIDNARSISKSYTIDASSTWEKKTITFVGDTTGAFGNDNGQSFRLTFWLGSGSNFTSGTLATSWQSYNSADRAVGQVNLADSTSNYINITGVQLEAGTTASDFEFLPYDVNLQRCQRYTTIFFETGGGGYAFFADGIARSTTQAIVLTSLPVTMRANPSVTTTGNFRLQDGVTTVAVTGIVTTNQSPHMLSLDVAVASGLTQYRPQFFGQNASFAKLILSSEL